MHLAKSVDGTAASDATAVAVRNCWACARGPQPHGGSNQRPLGSEACTQAQAPPPRRSAMAGRAYFSTSGRRGSGSASPCCRRHFRLCARVPRRRERGVPVLPRPSVVSGHTYARESKTKRSLPGSAPASAAADLRAAARVVNVPAGCPPRTALCSPSLKRDDSSGTAASRLRRPRALVLAPRWP